MHFVVYEHLASEVLHTGLPLLIVASHGGFDLVGLDPSQQTRRFLAHFFSFFTFPAFSFFTLAAGTLPSAQILGLSQVAFFPADPSLQVGRAPSAHFSFRPDFTESFFAVAAMTLIARRQSRTLSTGLMVGGE